MPRENAIWATGVMSGTSLDGVDWADILTDGHEIFEFGANGFRPYSNEEQGILHSALGSWPNENSNSLGAAMDVVMGSHVEALEDCTGEVVGFHGQTLNHDPLSSRTFQLGNGAALARALDRTVVWDFRTADVTVGGQGAPLAPFYHHALARRANITEPVAFLNLGGVGNITWIENPSLPPEEEGNLIAFDTGPANAPINDLMLRHYNMAFDLDGEVATSGEAFQETIQRFTEMPYFQKVPPKSLDRNEFEPFLMELQDLEPADAVATATHLCAVGVVKALSFLPKSPTTIFMCGGGRKNRSLVGAIIERLMEVTQLLIVPVERLKIDGDMLEAQAFAYLAVRVLNGLPISAPGTTGVPEPMTGGQISKP